MRQGRLMRMILAGLAVVGAVAFTAVAWRPAISIDPSPPSFASARIVKGAQLAAIGNCITCHTKPEGAAYAGGRPIATPFGAVHATNITPDRETGIGGWSRAAFVRAMREGVSR